MNSVNTSGVTDLAAKAAEVGRAWSRPKNTSGMEPCGRAVLVEPYEPKARGGGVLIIPDSVLASERALDVKVRVVEVGPHCWPDEQARCEAGDVVLVARMSGFVTVGPADGKPYRFVNDRDIFARYVTKAEVPNV